MMDQLLAQQMAAKLVGNSIGGWLIHKFLDNGKSAAVFLAERGSDQAALKIFDPEIVQRYGRDAQLGRIERELSLVGKAHPNLVRILGGGQDGDFLFVAMEYFENQKLSDTLHTLPTSATRALISQIASAAKFLEDSSFAHRDIKPDNIGVSMDMKVAKLLDLGVIRPFDLSSVTDEGDQRYFVGTLQYSPPELLFREEEHTVEGWRAVTFYQLGGVLHDLLMRQPLFENFKNPYGKLVRAVEREIPCINAPDEEADLRFLAQNCLAKIPRHRLDTVKWEDFWQPKVADPLDAARRKIAQHRSAAAQAAPTPSPPAGDLLNIQCFALRVSIHSAVVSTCKSESLPRYSTQTIREPNPYLLRILFEPSSKDGTRLFMGVYCQGVVLDAAANVHELRLWACATETREAVPAEAFLAAPCQILKGTLIDQDIRLRVHDFLLLAYAYLLDSSPIQAEPVHWFKIEDNI